MALSRSYTLRHRRVVISLLGAAYVALNKASTDSFVDAVLALIRSPVPVLDALLRKPTGALPLSTG